MSQGDFHENLDTLLKTLKGEAETLVRSPSSTVAPPSDGAVGRRALEVLKRLTHDPNALVDEAPLGQGGMGVVRLAKQVALDRKVAIKFLRPEHRAAKDVESLLSEAWLAGALEHPNILPIHALSLDEAGLPVIVMKHIEGRTWSTLIRDPAAMAAHAPGKAPLDEHLRILQQVCHAAHFAHARGVVHRDLKPENVMVGAFGEVYVVDWGIACPPGPSQQLAGTPAYMAPEMLGQRGAVVDARTDVYLLGSMLFEVLAGKPPHRGASPSELFETVLKSSPPLPDGAPEELAQLVRRCMQADASKRPASALEVRRALESFLEHQGSLSLTRQSERRLTELHALLATATPDATRVYGLFSECRFGFQQALATWDGNPHARDGWKAALRAMVGFEAAHGSASTARALYAELGEADATLETKLAAADARTEEHARKLKRLAQLETELDPLTGSSVRMLVAIAISVLWVISPYLGRFVAARLPAYEGVTSVPIAVLTLLIVGVVTWRSRESLRSTPLNRHLTSILVFGMSLQILFLTGRFLLLGPFGPGIVPALAGYWGVIAGVATVSIFRPLWPTALAYGVSATAGMLDLEHRYEWGMLGNLVFCANAFFIWKQQRHEERRRAG